MSQKTAPINLSAIDVEKLPSLAELFGGELEMAIHREIAKVVVNLRDTSAPADAERTITATLGFVPDADRQSALYSVEKLESRLAGSTVPKAARIVFRRTAETLEAFLHTGTREGIDPGAEPVPVIDVSNLSMAVLFDGGLDDAFRRELVPVLLNIDDPRTEAAHKRTISIVLTFTADPDRSAITYRLKSIRSHLAGCKPPNPSVLYLEQSKGRMTLELEPTVFLEGDDGVVAARQSSLN